MGLDIRHMKAFLAVAEEASFVRAAHRMNVAQPAISRTISKIEGELGVQLFTRTTRSVQLTRAGEVFMTQARLTIAQLARGLELTKEVASGYDGHVDIGYMDFAINGPMMSIIRQFASSAPNIKVHLQRRRSDDQSHDVANKRLDVGFCIRHRFDPGLDCWLINSEPLVAVLPAQHRLAPQGRVRVSDFADEPFILGNRQGWQMYLPTVEAFCVQAGFAPRVAYEASHGASMFGLVALGLGVTFYPACARSLVPSGVAVKDFVDNPPIIETFVLTRRDEINPAVKILVELISKYGRLYHTHERRS